MFYPKYEVLFMKKTLFAFAGLLSSGSLQAMNTTNGMLASVSKASLSQALVQKIEYDRDPVEVLQEVEYYLENEGEVAKKKAILARVQDGAGLYAALSAQQKNGPLIKVLIDNGSGLTVKTRNGDLKLADMICTVDRSLIKSPTSIKVSEYVADSFLSVRCGFSAVKIAEMLKKRQKVYSASNKEVELEEMSDKDIVDELAALHAKTKKDLTRIEELTRAFEACEEKIGAQPDKKSYTGNHDDDGSLGEHPDKKNANQAISGKSSFNIVSVALGAVLGGAVVLVAAKTLSSQAN
jgi:hypothetical protein